MAQRKLTVKDCLAAGFTDEQIKLLVESGKVQSSPTAKVVDYTTSSGKRAKYISVPSSRVFVEVSKVEEVIEMLQAGLERFKAGKVDETKQSSQYNPEQ